MTPTDPHALYTEFCEHHCSNRHHPDHMHHRECLNCSAMEFCDWLEEMAKDGDQK